LTPFERGLQDEFDPKNALTTDVPTISDLDRYTISNAGRFAQVAFGPSLEAQLLHQW
jgi:hypothetical protein